MEKIVLKDSLGYFDNEKKEYVIENMYPLRPLINFLWNDKVVCRCNHFGDGETFVCEKGYRRFIDKGIRAIYIKDLETGEVYSPNKNFSKLNFDKFCSYVGLGYSIIESEYKGIYVKFTVVVPADNSGAISFHIEIKNLSNKTRNLSVFFLDEVFADLTPHDAYGKGIKDEKYGGLYFPHEGFEEDHPTDLTHLYFASEKEFSSYAVVLRDVIGTYGSFVLPEYIMQGKLPSRGSVFEEKYVACVGYDLVLESNQTADYSFALAAGVDLDQAAQLAILNASKKQIDKNIIENKRINDIPLNKYQANIPDKYIETLINIWLKRQVSLGKTWGRIYGKGFRDVMQDNTAFVSFDVEKAKERIITALAHQYKNGNSIRMFDPDNKAAYNDGATWIPDAVTAYIKESGDYAILDEVVPYLDGGEATVLEHIHQGMLYLTTDIGERGLVLFRRGDWNDSTNGAGNLGKGESVWTSLATVRALKQYAELLEKLGKKEEQADMFARAEKLTENILKHGLYDGHYIHGYDDWGKMVGGGEPTEEASFCLNMQTWSVLADVGSKELQKQMMDMVEEKLKCAYGYRLNTPAYTKPQDCVGRTSYFRPGLIENASVYIHGSMFKAVADCMLGRGDNAYETVRSVTYRNNPNSGVEPYAVSNMLIGPDSDYRAGEAPMSWITGSAGWMYRALTEFILGVRADYDGLRIQPNIPQDWDNFSVKRVCRGTTYDIQFSRGDTFTITVNGKESKEKYIPYAQQGENVKVEVIYL